MKKIRLSLFSSASIECNLEIAGHYRLPPLFTLANLVLLTNDEPWRFILYFKPYTKKV